MSREIVKRFVDKLETSSISDYNGLKSSGLTCYLNSVLQVLFMTRHFRDAVISSCSKTTIDSHLKDLFCSLERKATPTRAIIKCLGITDVYEQHDAAEYLEKVLCRTSEEASQIFRGKLDNKTTCLACKDENHSYNLFWLLPLPEDDVREGLDSFFRAQTISGDNQLYCKQCRKEQASKIECEIEHAPGVVILLLKRFTFDVSRRRYVKFQCNATVMETICIGGSTYHLYAVINHFGTLTGGHYTAEIKSFETGFWYCFNDEIVKTLKKQLFGQGKAFFKSSSAYILLYKKVNKESKKTHGRNIETQPAQPDDQHERGHDKTTRRETPHCLTQTSFNHHAVDWSVDVPDRNGFHIGWTPTDDHRKWRRSTNEIKQFQERSNRQEALRQSTRKHETGPKEPWRY